MRIARDELPSRAQFLGRVLGAGGAGLALLFVAGCGEEEDDDEGGGGGGEEEDD